ncbi:conserved hypothetical protein [Sphingomonas aurantiaca]|uniref:DUF4062 domain-containing protein n=2 Tax=Sphingomonas aurantiaca TaxID=185949 RepID=A0A5E8A0A4_9SPHN|nr:conserved hypothetical protein [Sphingomonas aurantiaca]
MGKKYQIFVSSTFRDLSDERQDTIRSILDLGHIPAGMELFPAADTEQLLYIKKVIDECDYYILIIGGRYGSLDAEGVSFTEREYDYAVETGKIVLAFIHGNAATIPVGKSDTAQRLVQSLEEFRNKVMSGRLVREWISRENLEAMVVKSIARATSEYPAVGWIRGDEVASEDLLKQINDLRLENISLSKGLAAANAALRPSIENLADFAEEVELNFRRSYTFNGRTKYTASTETLTWLEIFKAVGINVAIPRISTLISSYIFERLKVDTPDLIFKTLLDEDNAKVKHQLAALGLIRVYVGQSTKGATHEWMQITPLGSKTLAELLAVKSKA